MKLFRILERRHVAGSWLAFSSPLLATLPGCMKMQPGFLVCVPFQALKGPQNAAIVNIASIHF
ncbi:hypothetical protein FJ987_23650 [Mesorhizobium sp. CU2]|uniref:hypothetical protein n=1 Tax=unclassified Mesorhizobium TaxID=325217 RepID=UPI00112A2EAE|nr:MULTISPECIES: hypothetical protein [unclassified Mesorhizobium]TPN88274.1 hypothetical protein FJ988_04275 [Mesorhizobium sp. CU3]TPO08099.1 hypothetical protein FJ987_23650 [Mesorhizobium sp. CU2]